MRLPPCACCVCLVSFRSIVLVAVRVPSPATQMEWARLYLSLALRRLALWALRLCRVCDPLSLVEQVVAGAALVCVGQHQSTIPRAVTTVLPP
jgi:hypothetical protein